MKLKVTIEADGKSASGEITDDFASFALPLLLEEVCKKVGLMVEGETLEILNSDEEALLSKSGY